MARPIAIGLLILVLGGCASPVPPIASSSAHPTASAEHASPALAATCPVSPFGSITPNDVVGTEGWQQAAPDLWAHPYVAAPTVTSGFAGSDPGVKILWWAPDASDAPLLLTITSFDPGGYAARYTFDPPGPGRHDRPTGFATPPAGCYVIEAAIGATSGAVVDRVLP
jgi:hypothetical protein